MAQVITISPRKKTRRQIDDQIYERQVEICKAFANPTRLRILDLLAKQPCSASQLQKQLSVAKANLSQHLTVLKQAGVVVSRRQGKQVFCSLAIPEVKTACQLIRDVLRAQIKKDSQMAI
jgi:ArsR family transcriptional regulator, virulence genes transcriptional regulator